MKQSFDTVLRQATVFTFEGPHLGALPKGAVGIKDGLIDWVGLENNLPKDKIGKDTKIIDCEGQAILPGFIDCHSHIVYAGNRAHDFECRLLGQSYQAIHQQGGGIMSTVRATREASFDTLEKQSLQRLVCMIEQGVTTLEIKSGYGLDLATERKILEVAKALEVKTGITIFKTFLGAHATPPESLSKKDYLESVVHEILPTLVQEGLVDAVDGFCESIAFSVTELETLFKQAQRFNLPIKLHAEQLSHQGGTLLASKYSALSVDHLEYANEEDVAALAQSNTVAVLLPGAYFFLQEMQKPPIELLRQYGVPMAIATDSNPGSSPTTSLLSMMNMSSILFKLTPEEVLLGVTVHAAQALGLGDRGQLVPGKRADCVLWEIEHPRDLVYSMGSHRCMKMIKQGKLIYEKPAFRSLASN